MSSKPASSSGATSSLAFSIKAEEVITCLMPESSRHASMEAVPAV